jgi:hypothetical protein
MTQWLLKYSLVDLINQELIISAEQKHPSGVFVCSKLVI